MPAPIAAVIFDFDGVIVDTEPLHLAAFRDALEPEGIVLTDADYWDRYLGFDDREAITTALSDAGRTPTAERVAALMSAKAGRFLALVQSGVPLFPGVAAFVRAAAERGPVAIGSGALRAEIELILTAVGLRSAFRAIVSAEDVAHGKPHPETYDLARAAIASLVPGLRPEACLVVEDSRAGVQAAKAAGMRCLAVTNSSAPELLSGADLIVDSLEGVEWPVLDALG